jgi:integrase
MNLVNLKPVKSKRRSVTQRLQRRLQEFGEKGDYHSIRHTYGERLEEQGLEFLEVKFLMGHRIDDITWRYIHKNVSKFKPAIYNI